MKRRNVFQAAIAAVAGLLGKSFGNSQASCDKDLRPNLGNPRKADAKSPASKLGPVRRMNGHRYTVQGAGQLVIEGFPDEVWHTGTAYGLAIGVSWATPYGEAGGVLDRTEVERLVCDISAWLENTPNFHEPENLKSDK